MPIELRDVVEAMRQAYAKGAYRRLDGHERVAIFVRETPFKAGSEFRIGPHPYKVEEDSYLGFVDLRYDANFSHPVIYELHNVRDGSVRTIEEEWPLADAQMERSLTPIVLPGREGK